MADTGVGEATSVRTARLATYPHCTRATADPQGPARIAREEQPCADGGGTAGIAPIGGPAVGMVEHDPLVAIWPHGHVGVVECANHADIDEHRPCHGSIGASAQPPLQLSGRFRAMQALQLMLLGW